MSVRPRAVGWSCGDVYACAEFLWPFQSPRGGRKLRATMVEVHGGSGHSLVLRPPTTPAAFSAARHCPADHCCRRSLLNHTQRGVLRHTNSPHARAHGRTHARIAPLYYAWTQGRPPPPRQPLALALALPPRQVGRPRQPPRRRPRLSQPQPQPEQEQEPERRPRRTSGQGEPYEQRQERQQRQEEE